MGIFFEGEFMHNYEELQKYKGQIFNGEWPTILEMLDITLLKHRKRDCFIVYRKDKEIIYSFDDLEKNIKRVGSFLIEQGIKKGDKVIINGKNSPEWAFAYFGVLYAGGIVVPIDNMMDTDKMVKLAIFCDAKFIFADKDVLEKLEKEPENKAIIESKKAWMESLLGIKEVILQSQDFKEKNCLCNLTSNEKPRVEIKDSDDAALLFTSGTTGNEKGVLLSEANLVSDVYMASDGQFFELTYKDTMFAFLPLHHSYCCTAVLLEGLCNGNRCLFGQSMAMTSLIKDMKRAKVTFFMGIPLVYNKLLSATMSKIRKKGAFTYFKVRLFMRINSFLKKNFHLNPGKKMFKEILQALGFEQMRVCICGAGPLSPKVFRDYQGLGLDFVQGYGLTETSPILTLNPISHFKVTSVGKIFDLVDMKIINPDILGVGEIVVKGPNVTKGYFNDEENTKKLFTEDGYLKTGDIGLIDKENYLHLKGRAKNLIVTSGGKNVYPEEIEDKFQLFEEINQIMVRGYKEKSESHEEYIEALVYPEMTKFEGQNFGQIEDIIQKLVDEVNSKQVYYMKINRVIVLKEPMEMTTTKKIKRGFVS